MRKLAFTMVTAILLFGCAAPQKEVMEKIFYPPLPLEPKIQFLTYISNEDQLGGKQSKFNEFLLGQPLTSKGIVTPYDVGALKGNIYIVDRAINSVIIANLVDKKFNLLKTKGLGSLSEPAGMTVTENGYKYVSDFGRKQIVVFDNENKYVKAYGKLDQFIKPIDVAVFQDRLYVCDFGLHQIVVLDLDSGDTVQTIGELGGGEGQLLKPTHIDIDDLGTVYVDDAFNFRIQLFDLDGEYMKTIGYHGDTFGGLSRPKGIAADKDGLLYVVDTAFENVQIFDVETRRLMLYFGGFSGMGGMTLPNGIFIDYDSYNIDFFKKYADKDFNIQYLIYVTNLVGDEKVNVYGFGDWTGDLVPASASPAE
jgi:DNA-binding beta-propeller fold protein YncE